VDISEKRRLVVQEQLQKLRRMLGEVVQTNRFYRKKLSGHDLSRIDSLEKFRTLPFTTKEELVGDQAEHPPFGSNLTFPLERYIRIHRTSGTTGAPLYWLDTEESWNWFADCWAVVLRAAGVRAADRVYFAFSFGPFIGFWSGWEGARKIGALAISGGGQSTLQRLQAIVEHRATVVVCTPTYALHLAAEAAKADIDLARGSKVRIVLVAGEPGANIKGTKRKIEEAWGARCYDHPGATEVGAWGFECEPQPGGVHINETEFIAEVVQSETGRAAAPGERGELVMTNLGRAGSPVIRYRTGDLVQAGDRPCPCASSFLSLEGGVLGRVDDMVIVRGVNVYPAAVEGIVRSFSEIEEFRVEVFATDGLSDLKLTLEPAASSNSPEEFKERVRSRVQNALGLRPTVELVGPGALPRFELKARRFFKR